MIYAFVEPLFDDWNAMPCVRLTWKEGDEQSRALAIRLWQGPDLIKSGRLDGAVAIRGQFK